MTKQEVRDLVLLIRAYYPMKKILDNELETLVWCNEFVDYDKDIVIKATRELCNEDVTGININIAGIKKRVKELEEEIKQKEILKKSYERLMRMNQKT